MPLSNSTLNPFRQNVAIWQPWIMNQCFVTRSSLAIIYNSFSHSIITLTHCSAYSCILNYKNILFLSRIMAPTGTLWAYTRLKKDWTLQHVLSWIYQWVSARVMHRSSVVSVMSLSVHSVRQWSITPSWPVCTETTVAGKNVSARSIHTDTAHL